MTFQAPLGRNIDIPNSLAYVRRAYKALGPDRLVAIAIGNEVSFYEPGAEAYVNNATTLEDRIVDALNLTGSSAKIFEVLDLPSHSNESVLKWTL